MPKMLRFVVQMLGNCTCIYFLYQLLFNNLDSAFWRILVFVLFIINAVIINLDKLIEIKAPQKTKPERLLTP